MGSKYEMEAGHLFRPVAVLLLCAVGLADADRLAAQEPRPLELRLVVDQVEPAESDAGTGGEDSGPAVEKLRAKVRLYDPEGLLADADAPPVEFEAPLGGKDLRELRWYLEEYWRWPSEIDRERAAKLEQRLTSWGQKLFASVFQGTEAIRLWQRFWDQQERPRLLTIDSTKPVVLRLPWELLADPQKGFLFSWDISVRRRLQDGVPAQQRPFELPLRVLMVVPRPDELGFVDPRASSKALLAGLEGLGEDNARVEFLHPPTLDALNRRLRDRTAPVHVVHFDGHGVYRAEQGLGYLAFEDAEGGLHRADAESLGTLLKRVPLLVLDACQSAYADTTDPFSSVAPQLIKNGAGSVVAMQYSVLVETTRRFFASFYRALAAGASIGAATDAGRQTLLADPKRMELPRRDAEPLKLELTDWFLPALYQQSIDPAPFAAVANRARPATGETPVDDAALGLAGGFPRPRYRFVGRAKEIWELERELRSRRIVVLQGLAGMGKTALASETARWLGRKGLFARGLFVSFEDGSGIDWLILHMGRLLEGEDFSARPRGQQRAAVLAALRAVPTLVVWDNFESVMPGWERELAAGELEKVLAFGEELSRQGGSRLLVTTRDPKLPHSAYQPSQWMRLYQLGELPLGEAMELTGNVLDDRGLERPPRRDLERLLGFLGGHPLSIQLVVPQLSRFGNDVERVIERFEELYPGFKEGKVVARNDSLEASLSFSMDRLSPSTRERIRVLGVFEGGAIDFAIPNVAGMEGEEWRAVSGEILGELQQAGLLRREQVPFPLRAFSALGGEEADAELAEVVPVPYHVFHPTLAPHLRALLAPEERAAMEERYRGFYYYLSDVLYQLDSRRPHEARAVVQRELPNLRRAFELTLEAGDDAVAAHFGDNISSFLDALGRWQEQETLLARLGKSVAGAAGLSGPLTRAEFYRQSRQGEFLLSQGRGLEAEAVFRRLLARMDSGMAYEGLVANYGRAVTRSRIGDSLEARGLAREAEAEHRRALELLRTLDPENRTVQNLIGALHVDLGDVLTAQGRFSEAREHYEEALKIDTALGDLKGAAVDEGQLGQLALAQNDFDEARRRYTEARAAFHELGEPRQEAAVYHQLGIVAQEQASRASGEDRQALLDEAAAAYKKSLRLEESLGDRQARRRPLVNWP